MSRRGSFRIAIITATRSIDVAMNVVAVAVAWFAGAEAKVAVFATDQRRTAAAAVVWKK